MPRPSRQLAEEFRARLNSLDSTRGRVEDLLVGGHISSEDVSGIYEGLFLRATASFEAFLEDLFVGLLVGSRGLVSARPRVHPRVTVGTHTVARDLITGDRRFVSWLPYDLTKKRAEAFFTGGRPFTLLPGALEDDIQKCLWIRNAIAHRSWYARHVFERNVIGTLPLSPRERIPAGYLRSVLTAAPRQLRYEYLAARMLGAATFLAR